jgi:hypothetical protein
MDDPGFNSCQGQETNSCLKYQNWSEAQQASYLKGTEGFFPGDKVAKT